MLVAIWPREVVSCRDFILRAVPTFWAMSLVGIYPGRASLRSFFRISVPLGIQMIKKLSLIIYYRIMINLVILYCALHVVSITFKRVLSLDFVSL